MKDLKFTTAGDYMEDAFEKGYPSYDAVHRDEQTMTTQVIYDATIDEYILDIGEEMMEQLGWNVGDTIEWVDNGDGSYTLRKQTKAYK